MNDNFKFVIPAEIVKSKDGDWKVAGLASTPSVDRQGEVILQDGIDCTPIESGKGFFNFDHDNSPENTLGLLDRYQKSSKGLYVQGRLFKNHARAKAVYEIMSSLKDGDKGRVGMSVEGKVIERDPMNPKLIKRCVIRNVALTLNPVNQDTYADIIKSMSSEAEVDFQSDGKPEAVLGLDGIATTPEKEQPTFTATQVISIVQKALGIGGAGGGSYGNTPPAQLSGGAALQQESPKKKKKLKKMSPELYKANMISLLDKLQRLYPEVSRNVIWDAVKTRMETEFPEVTEIGKAGNSQDVK